MKKIFITALGLMLLLSTGTYSCKSSPGQNSDSQDSSDAPDPVEIVVELEHFSGASAQVETLHRQTGEELVHIPENGWISFDVPVQIAGRYRVEVRFTAGLKSSVTCWVETYIDNKDERTYNITGSMILPLPDSNDRFVHSAIDGSPLNRGTHKMKLHVEGGEATADWIKFTLLKEHQLTPETLTQQTNGEEWKVVWSDEFEEGELPDLSKWTYDIGDWGWGNNELQYYTEGRKENARIENGNLIIEAHKNQKGEKWTSARLTTRGKTSFVYGKIEFKAKVPVGRGNWTAGWTLGDKYVDELSWPYCGEIDILECVGFEIDDQTGDGLHHASVHCGAYYFKLNNQPTGITEVKSMNSEYHLYAIEWTPDYIKAFVDDKPYFTYEDTSDSLTWPFNEPQNIIVNLAMGGGWGGAQGMDESLTKQELVIDYVRVYERR